MLPSFANLTVERQRGVSAEDTHGNDTIDWTDPDRLAIERCWIGRPSGVEVSDDRQTIVAQQWWWGPEDADVISTDRLMDVETGVVYEVDSPVMLERDPVGPYSHKLCRLKAIEE